MSPSSGRVPTGRRSSEPFMNTGSRRFDWMRSATRLRNRGQAVYDPETFEFIAELTQYARSLGLEVLVEIHALPPTD